MGHVGDEEQTKDAGLFNQPLPASDSDVTIFLDLFGTTKTITVPGVFTGSFAQLNTFIVAIEAIENGNQSGVTYVSSLSTYANKKVFVTSFNWRYMKGSPNKINYTLNLSEGA